jgi:hypothetical protein
MIRLHTRYIVGAIILGLLLGSFSALRAQTLQFSFSPKQIRIGERISVRVALNVPDTNAQVTIGWPDSIPHFEPIGMHKPVFKTGATGAAFTQEWVLTSFDSGRWVFPSFPVTWQRGNQVETSYTDSVQVDVGYAPADSSKEIRDIKPMMPAPVRNDGFYYILAASLLALFALIYALYLWRRPKQYRGLVSADAASAYDSAMQQLDELAQTSISNEADKRQFHIRLSTIFRTYLGRTVLQPGLQSTSSDVTWFYQSKHWLDAAQTEQLNEAMQLSDAVKFARYNPSASDSLDVLQHIRRVIQSTQAHLQSSQTG